MYFAERRRANLEWSAGTKSWRSWFLELPFSVGVCLETFWILIETLLMSRYWCCFHGWFKVIWDDLRSVILFFFVPCIDDQLFEIFMNFGVLAVIISTEVSQFLYDVYAAYKLCLTWSIFQRGGAVAACPGKPVLPRPQRSIFVDVNDRMRRNTTNRPFILSASCVFTTPVQPPTHRPQVKPSNTLGTGAQTNWSRHFRCVVFT